MSLADWLFFINTSYMQICLRGKILTSLRYVWGFQGGASSKEPAPQCRRSKRRGFDSRVRKIPWRRDSLPTPVFLGFPGGLAGKESTCSARDLGSIPGLGRSPGEENSYTLQYSGLESSMDCIVHGVAKNLT